ncbi:MAG TPA: phosphotransferase [Candidatus Paceibacterota bacterium]|jgi:tRNA A-37 threonylcarbamoyl transferase component Bud32
MSMHWPKPQGSINDYEDSSELFNLLKSIPIEMRATHLQRIEELSDDDAAAYLREFIEQREAAMREGEVSDPSIREYFEAHKEEIWRTLETDVFSDPDNLLGNGQTARVMQFVLEDREHGMEVPLGIKYLVSPGEKTLSAKGEHNLVREVERLQLIEQAEAIHAAEAVHVRVPHPYFHYRNADFQCYGMERINGINLERWTKGEGSEELRTALTKAFRDVDPQEFAHEIDLFFDAMHTVCLHGSIKPDNLMVSREGRLYVIDFGDSRPIHDLDEQEEKNLDTLREDEKARAKVILMSFFASLKEAP